MPSQPMTIFQVAGRAMSAQLVRMNTTASNLANAGGVAGSAEAAYKTMKPVFRTSFDAATGLATAALAVVDAVEAMPRLDRVVSKLMDYRPSLRVSTMRPLAVFITSTLF